MGDYSMNIHVTFVPKIPLFGKGDRVDFMDNFLIIKILPNLPFPKGGRNTWDFHVSL
jgi:hypothetical protein